MRENQPTHVSHHGLRMPREEIAFTARPKIHSHSQIFRYGRSIFCLPHRPNFSDIFDLCLHWVSVVRVHMYFISTLNLNEVNIFFFIPKFFKKLALMINSHKESGIYFISMLKVLKSVKSSDISDVAHKVI